MPGSFHVSHEKLVRLCPLLHLVALNQNVIWKPFCLLRALWQWHIVDESFEVICKTVINSVGTIGGMIVTEQTQYPRFGARLIRLLVSYMLAKDGFAFAHGKDLLRKILIRRLQIGRNGQWVWRILTLKFSMVMIGNKEVVWPGFAGAVKDPQRSLKYTPASG